MIPSCYALRQRFLRIGCAAAILFILSDDRTAIARQTGIQRTQDGHHILVNKDVSAERWAISLNADGTLTGNVFRTDGGAPAFIFCAPLEEPNSFRCSGADPCTIGGASRGIQGTPDGKRVLVNKDVNSERWAIGRNDDGTVTGNVFRGDEGPPAFISCQPLAAPNSFRCSGASACVTEQCIDQYAFIADVTLPGDFFTLPVPCGAEYSFIADVALPAAFFDPASALECDGSCGQTQAGAVVTRTLGALQIGVTALPAPAAVIAGGTTPDCPDGGFSTGDENGFTDVDCRNGDLVSNGSVVFSDIPPTQDRQASFAGFSVRRISTGETLVSSGALIVSRQDASVTINGSVARSSNLLGEYDETFTDVVGVESGEGVAMASGTVLTAVTSGLGAFTSVDTMQSHIRGPQLVIVVVTFQNASQQVTIHEVSDIGLCDPCVTNADCDAQLACQPCVPGSGCTGTTKRCSVDFQNFGAQCGDGLF